MSFWKRLKIYCCYRPNLEEDFMIFTPETHQKHVCCMKN